MCPSVLTHTLPASSLCVVSSSELLTRIRRAGRCDRLHLYEWSRRGWSYHAKGLWLSVGPDAAPLLTLIGSPNFGARSVQRDTESSLIVLTRPKSMLATQLATEKQQLMRHAKLVTLDGARTDPTYTGPVETAVAPPLWLRILSMLARPYM
jgi:phosphatidylserine/phosphatidylglycerophosphate/cardiolipin synthase-like enzyme